MFSQELCKARISWSLVTGISTCVNLERLARRLYQEPAARCLSMFPLALIFLPDYCIVFISRRGAEIKQFACTILGNWRFVLWVVILLGPPRLIWCSLHLCSYKERPWRYILLPHVPPLPPVVAENCPWQRKFDNLLHILRAVENTAALCKKIIRWDKNEWTRNCTAIYQKVAGEQSFQMGRNWLSSFKGVSHRADPPPPN